MRKITFLIVLILASFMCGITFAQETVEVTTVTKTEPAKQRIDIGAGYWYTQSTLDSFVYASTEDSWTGLFYNLGDKISELNNELDSGMFIVTADAWIWWRIYASGFVGFGEFDGEHTDSDWLPVLDSAKWLESVSDAKGDVRTWNINGYLRVIEEEQDKGYLDLALGYQYYRDDIEHLENSTQTITNWVATNTPIVGHDSQDRYTYDGFRIGLRGKIRLHERVAVKLSGGFMPWIEVKDKGYWNLREMDIDASADATAFDITGGIEFKIIEHVFIEAGYKYMSFDSDKGDDTRTLSDGTQVTFSDAFEARGHRGGFYAMGRIKI